MKVNKGTFLVPAASLLLPGCGQLLQGRFSLGLRHLTTDVLISTVALTPAVSWVGILAAILHFALACWSAYEARRWQGTGEPSRLPTQPSAKQPLLPKPTWHRAVATLAGVVVAGLFVL